MGGNNAKTRKNASNNEFQPSSTSPELTIGTLKSAIPTSCFQSSTFVSLSYLFRDIVYASCLVYLALHIPRVPSPLLRFILWTTYTVVQGFVGTGLWILGHECGHGAFSPSPLVNNTIGLIVHSVLLVPYHSWRITHARHHRYTNHIEKDVVFIPPLASEDERGRASGNKAKKSKLGTAKELLEETPLYTLLHLLGHQLLGWQIYLLFNATSGRKSLPKDGGDRWWLPNESHFDPLSRLFTKEQRKLVWLSDLGLLSMAAVLWKVATLVGTKEMVLLHIVPYFWVHHWLVAITYLHHTHSDVPHYTDSEWTYVKGALCTIDRSFGFVGRHFFHDIIDYHVIHHLFPKIPFYKAKEATEAIAPLLGNQYHQAKNESFLGSLFTTYRNCNYVEASRPGIMHWVKA